MKNCGASPGDRVLDERAEKQRRQDSLHESVWTVAPSAAEPHHKKLIVIDDTTAYLGGINFSEHQRGLA